jgi:hypothetical protein
VFAIPEPDRPDATHVEIDEATLDALLEGILADDKRSQGKGDRTMH